MWSRAIKGDYLLLASLIALGFLTIFSAVAITRSISRSALTSDARQLAIHWAEHITAHAQGRSGARATPPPPCAAR